MSCMLTGPGVRVQPSEVIRAPTHADDDGGGRVETESMLCLADASAQPCYIDRACEVLQAFA